MPYNEFGEYIPDELALDAMKYELAKKGVMPLRPGGSDVPYVASEIPQTYVAKPPPAPASTAKNVPQAIADRLGLSAIPQAALGMVSSFPASVAKEMGFPKVAEAIQYTPTSKMGTEVLEGVSRLPQVLTGSEMGVGPLAEFYVPRRAFGLERRPFISPDDVRVMGSRAIETGRELRNIPEDFRAAQEGLRRESVFGGPTVGARAQGVAENIGDIMARRQMQGLSPIPGIPDIVPETKLYAVRPPNVGQMIDPIDLPTARYADENRAVQTAQNVIAEVTPYTGAEYPHNTKSEYYNSAVRDAPTEVLDAWKNFSQKKINEMFPDAPTPKDAVEAFQNKFDQRTFSLEQMNMLSEFAKSPEAQEAVNTFADRRDELINEYNKEKNKPRKDLKTDEDRRAHQEKVDQMELELLQKNLMPELSRDEFVKRITPPTLEEYMRRAKAAKEYLEGTFKKDISKYIGTSQGPQMELAKRGVTLAPREELLEYARRLEANRGAFRGEFAEVQKARAKAGFNPKGEMFPLIEKKEAEVKDLQSKLNDLNRQKSELRDLHRVELPDEPDPARNPGETGAKYRALTNPMNALIDKIEQSKKQLENFKLANAYELISDVAYTPVTAKQFKELIPYAEKQFFPNLAKTPNEAQMFNVKSRELGELGVPLLAEMIAKDILSGRIPLDEKGKPMTSIDKEVERLTKPRLKEESIKEAESRKGMIQLNDFAQESLSKIPANLRFKNASVLELTKDSTESAIRRQISFDGMVLDHCIAGCDAPHPGINPFSGEKYDYSYPVDPATGKDRGGRKLLSGYMKRVKEGDERTSHLRDNVTGLPVVTINMHRNDNGTYRLGYVSGYKNKADKPQYAEDIKDYLNARSDIISGSGDALEKWGILDMMKNRDLSKAASMLRVPATESSITNLGIPRFVLESEVRALALQQPVGNTHADLVARRAQLNDEYNRIVRDRGEDDPEAVDIADDIQDLTARLENMSRQITTQAPDRPSVYRRMSSEALTNGLQLEGRLEEVTDLIGRTVSIANTNGLVDFWADDYEFFPERLRTFTNAIRNDENLSQAMTAEYGGGYTPQDRERLARFQLAIQDFTPHMREVLVRELDRYAEANILAQIDVLNPDDPEEGQRQYENAHPEVPDYLEEISRRRRGEDFTPEAAPAQTRMPVPRDIAEQVVSQTMPSRDQAVQRFTETLNDVIRNLPEDRETLREALAQYQRDPHDLPGRLEMLLAPDGRLAETRDIVSNYLIQQIQNRLGNQAPAPVDVLEVGINLLANDIVPRNAAFRDQTVNDIRGAIRDEILPMIERLDPNNEADRRTLERELRFLETNPFDRDLGQRLETYIQNNSARENDIRGRVVDFMTDKIQRRLDQAPAPIDIFEEPLIPEHIRGVITREMNELMELGQLRQAGSLLDRIFARQGEFRDLTEEQRRHAADFTNSLLGQLLNDPNYRPAAFQLPAPAIADDRSIGTYRQRFTNELTGSRRAFDEVMQAERMTPGAINEAIRRTDGDARYNQDVMDFYRVNSPSGIAQLNNALRRYMEGNGFDIEAPAPARPVANQETLGDILNEALETTANNYAFNIVDTIQRDVDGLMTENIRFERNPRDFISRLNMLSNEARETGLEGDAVYATAVDELVTALNYGLEQIAAPAVNPIDELERRYGQERAPIDIVTDGLNLPIPQFERDYPPRVQDAYRQILSEIEPATSPANLRNAMDHLSHTHDIIENNELLPEELGLTTILEMDRLVQLIERHFEVFRELENLFDDADREPPEGRKRGGLIKMRKGGRPFRKENYPAPVEPEMQRPFDQELHDIFERLKSENTFDDGASLLEFQRKGSSSDQLGLAPRVFPRTPESDTSGQRHMDVQPDLYQPPARRYYNNGGRVNPVPTAARIESEAPKLPQIKPIVNPADPGFAEKLKYEIEQRQKAAARTSGGGGNLTDTELKNRLGSRNPTYNAGGKVSIDQMRYELLRKR